MWKHSNCTSYTPCLSWSAVPFANRMCCFCCRLKLFLEQFGIPTCVLNSELPAAIRCLSVNQFNQGVYDIIIASDERSLDEPHAVKHVGKKGY